MTEFHFLQPLDVLYLRGNRLFGDSSAPGEAIMPPWPSLAAGALRSQILASHGVDVGRFAQGKAALSGALAQSLGTPEQPGDFRISHFLLAKYENPMGATSMSRLSDVYLPLPQDVVVVSDGNRRKIYSLQPQSLPSGIATSAPCSQIPVLQTEKPAKPEGGLWLNSAGMQAWLNGQPIGADVLVTGNALWKIDSRLGIALAAQSRTTGDGQLYTVDAIALAKNMGFLAGVANANGLLPQRGVLRLGGDGRGAERFKVDWRPLQPDWDTIQRTRRFRLLLTTPGLFEQGWLLPGIKPQNGTYVWQTNGFSAQLVSASITRAETVSGWDIAVNHPKPALKAVSTGSVYWFDRFEGDVGALEKLVEHGLFHLDSYPDEKRRAEGFNNIMIGVWP